jgi:alginate O-acetyltransferase complex protein AlgI
VIFTTPEFYAFFAVFFGVWWALRGTARKVWLLAASYYFYGAWSVQFLGLLIASTVVDYWAARKLGEITEPHRRKQILGASLVFNLGVLGFFKYYDFFVESAHTLLLGLGMDVPLRALHVVLPVGISFYTFQSLSYTIDVYRGTLAPTRSLLDYASFVAAFPQLVAGPIERASHLLPQIAKIGTGVLRADHTGWFLIGLGAFKKAVVADNVAPYADIAYTHVDQSYPIALWVGTYAFAIQIYCDFSGYSDIAIGLGRLLGLDIMQNFRAPYAARGPSDFWRRWHISLSQWLRDYLYIPLGGNRGGSWFTARNLMITMLLGGLWHGAAWNFVLWGAYHGLLLMLARIPRLHGLGARIDALPGPGGRAVRVLQAVFFFHCICLGWALFRAGSLAECVTLFTKLLDPTGFQLAPWISAVRASREGAYLIIAGLLASGVVLAHLVLPIGGSELAEKTRHWPLALRCSVVATLLYAAAVFAPEHAAPFVYFQF